jgi:hypothetical protein
MHPRMHLRKGLKVDKRTRHYLCSAGIFTKVSGQFLVLDPSRSLVTHTLAVVFFIL